MSRSSAGRSAAGSLACQSLISHVEQAGGSGASVSEILWRIGGHPLLVAHARIFQHVAAALRSDVFSEPALFWAGRWRERIGLWLDTLALIERLEPKLRADPSLPELFREPRDADDHPLLRQGVGRHPLAAALFNRHQFAAHREAGTGQQAVDQYELTRAHVLAIYCEARERAAAGLDKFLIHDGDREFSAVPVGAGPVGLALRDLSLADYAPLLAQFPPTSNTPAFASQMAVLQPDYSVLQRDLIDRAARHFLQLQRYLGTLVSMLSVQQLQPRTRHVDEGSTGPGGHPHRPGWVGWSPGEITRREEHDWTEDGPPLTHVSFPAPEELDPLVEEAEGDAPGSTRDNDITLYDPAAAQKKMSALRFLALHQERRHTHFNWALNAASRTERCRALQAAQRGIAGLLEAPPRSLSAARQAAIGGMLVKACTLYGWSPATTAAIAILRVETLDERTAESLLYARQDHICLLASAPHGEDGSWSALAFLVPGLSANYRTQLSTETQAIGRPRQRCFLLSMVGGLGDELLALAGRHDRLPTAEPMSRRLLGVENKTAALLAQQCLSQAQDTVNQDKRAALTIQRLTASLQASMLAVTGDVVPGWMVMQDSRCIGEARLHYSQVRADKLPQQHLAALHKLDGDRWQASEARALELSLLQTGWVGCRFVADRDKVRELIQTLQCRLTSGLDTARLSAVRAHHNDFVLHAWLHMALTLGLRAGSGAGAPSLPFLIELRQGVPAPVQTDAIGLAEKHNGYQDKSRLLPLTPELLAAAARLEEHNSAILQHLDLFQDWLALDGAAQRLFVLDQRLRPAPLTSTWIRDRLAELGFPAPTNFGRALLRTEWADAGWPARWIDPFMGHAGQDQNCYSKHSSHDPAAYLEQVTKQSRQYADMLGLRPIRSPCVASGSAGNTAKASIAAATPELALPRIGLKHPAARSAIQPIWWKVNFDPPLPEALSQLWQDVRRHATASDRPLVTSLLWLLRNSSNHHAQALTTEARPEALVVDLASANSLEEEVLMTAVRHEFPLTVAASWLRLLRAAEGKLSPAWKAMVPTKTMALTTNAESPISTRQTMLLPNIRCWQAGLHKWIRGRAGDDDPRSWATAIGLSAALHGMVMDIRLLSSLMQWLAEPGLRKLQICSGKDGFAYMEFHLPSSVPGRRQLTRWFLDPLTEFLVLNAPSFPVTPELGSTSRYIRLFLQHHGVELHRCPGGWRTVIQAARALWSTRAPQHMVQCASRGISTTSLEPVCWQNLFGSTTLVSNRSGAQLENSVAPVSQWLTYEDLTFDPDDEATPAPGPKSNPLVASKWPTAGREVDYVRLDMMAASPWLDDADVAMRQPSGEVSSRLLSLQAQHEPDSFAHGALGWLAATADRLLAARSDASIDVMLGLRRAVKTLLPRLAAEAGGAWICTMGASQRQQVLGGLAHELESAVSRPDFKRGLALLLEDGKNISHSPDTADAMKSPLDDDIENPDLDARVDARMITVDQYVQALEHVRCGIDPPLRPSERGPLEDLLHLGIWSLARPREYLQARVGDFDWGEADELDLTIRETAEHGLKTHQATRRVPLSLLAPADVCQRIRRSLEDRIASSGEQGENARRLRLFNAPEGQNTKTYHDHLLGLLRQILRQVTGDAAFRVYSLRHAGANWVYMALEGDRSAVWDRLWAAHPLMLAYLRDGDGLRHRLLGSVDRTDRRALLSITLLQGHLAVATTFMHYLHTSSLLQLQSVYRYADDIPQAVLAAAALAKPANFSEQITAGWAASLRHARRRSGWTLSAGSRLPQPAAKGAKTQPHRWLLFSDVERLLDAHANQQQPVGHIATHFGVAEDFINAAIRASAGVADWIGAKVVRPASDALPTVQMPSARMNQAERLQLDHLVHNTHAAWRSAPRLVVNAIGLILDRTTRLHEELTLCDPEQLKTALAFFGHCGVEPRDLQFVLRRRSSSATIPDWAAPLLGAYAPTPVRVLPPDTKASDASLAQWLRIRLVDRKGQAIPQVLARAVFTAWVNLSAASASGNEA
jgi:hypothetical protein